MKKSTVRDNYQKSQIVQRRSTIWSLFHLIPKRVMLNCSTARLHPFCDMCHLQVQELGRIFYYVIVKLQIHPLILYYYPFINYFIYHYLTHTHPPSASPFHQSGFFTTSGQAPADSGADVPENFPARYFLTQIDRSIRLHHFWSFWAFDNHHSSLTRHPPSLLSPPMFHHLSPSVVWW